jgi:2-methylcitrate dehydratase
MDKTTERIVSYATSFTEAELTPAVKTAALDHLFDSIAAAIAGSDSEPGHIAAKLARGTRSEPAATVFGYGIQTAPELAAFANGAMIRT